MEGSEHTTAYGQEEQHFDGDACPQAVHGPEVGVSQFGQGTEGHCGKKNLNHRSSVCEAVSQKEPRDALRLKHQGRGQGDGQQRHQVHGTKGDVTHLLVVPLNAGHPAEEHTVAEFPQHGDGLPHEVDGPVVQAGFACAEFFSHQPNVHFRGSIGEQVEGRTPQSIAHKLADAGQFETLKNRDSREVEVAEAEDCVLDQQRADVSPNPSSLPSHGQADAEVAHDHAGQRTCGEHLEVHVANQQAPRDHAEPRNHEAEGNPSQHWAKHRLLVMECDFRCGHKHASEEHQPKGGAEPPRGCGVFGLQTGVLNHRRSDAHLGENLHHPNHNEGNGHDAKVFLGQEPRKDADVDKLQDDLQKHIEALPTQRSPPRGRAALLSHQRAMLTARRSRMTVILT